MNRWAGRLLRPTCPTTVGGCSQTPQPFHQAHGGDPRALHLLHPGRSSNLISFIQIWMLTHQWESWAFFVTFESEYVPTMSSSSLTFKVYCEGLFNCYYFLLWTMGGAFTLSFYQLHFFISKFVFKWWNKDPVLWFVILNKFNKAP